MKKFLHNAFRIILPLLFGALGAFLTRNHTDIYSSLRLPPFAPPSMLFPIVWSLLYLLMGIGYNIAYLKSRAVTAPLISQLIINILWPVIFFNLNAYLLAVLWLVLLIFLSVVMTAAFYRADKRAAYLQIPYFAWLLFALYLNIAVAVLN
ncbi:MAG: TspO/MBR family protein [Clostridia bacterium]|nr:TspO/MBR family protein [Clostridia bacterium]